MKIERAAGQRYLELATAVLQRERRRDPRAGAWEAADLQWWFTRDQHEDENDAVFFLDDDGPVAASVLNRSPKQPLACDILGPAGFQPAWAALAEQLAAQPAGTDAEMCVLTESADFAGELGFTEAGDSWWSTWLDPSKRPLPRPLPDGYSIAARPEQTGPHPMIGRNGEHIEERLRQCSLYDPECDLAVLAPDGTVAGYGLFWPDLVTGVGMVEPMRVEAEHGGRGLGGALLREGLDRLVRRGCRELKVSHEDTNPNSKALYLGAGFVPFRLETVYLRRASTNAA